MNILITNVSTVSIKDGKFTKGQYKDEQGNDFEGIMTNEAPIKSVIKRLNSDNQNLDKIIYIESVAVKSEITEPENGRKITHAELLRERIKEYCSENKFYSPEYDSIEIDDIPNDESVSKTVFNVYKGLCELILPEDNLNIYIESNGGVRYVLSMLLSVTKNLERQYKNVHIIEIMSMVYGKSPTKITNQKRVYDTSELIGIIDEFVNYGRPNGMIGYVNNLFKDTTDSKLKNRVKEILNKLSKIAEDIQLCRTEMILNHFYGTDNSIVQLIENFLTDYENSDDSSIRIFNYILNRISSEYRDLMPNPEEKNNISLNLPKIIKWCLDKDYTQQALTFCSEKIPDYLFHSNKIYLSPSMQELLDSMKTGDYEKNYYFIAHFRQDCLNKIVDGKINDVFNKMKSEAPDLFTTENWENAKLGTSIVANADIATVKQMKNFVHQYKKKKDNDLSKREILEDFFTQNNFDITWLDEKCEVSNKLRQSIELTLQGIKVSEDGEKTQYPYLKDKEIRIIKVIIALLRKIFSFYDNHPVYDEMIEKLFTQESPDFIEALKKEYSKKQSEKFYILDAFNAGCVNSTMEANSIQELLYLYSLCKEQRNFSNHAHFDENKATVVMDANQLKKLIEALLEKCS